MSIGGGGGIRGPPLGTARRAANTAWISAASRAPTALSISTATSSGAGGGAGTTGTGTGCRAGAATATIASGGGAAAATTGAGTGRGAGAGTTGCGAAAATTGSSRASPGKGRLAARFLVRPKQRRTAQQQESAIRLNTAPTIRAANRLALWSASSLIARSRRVSNTMTASLRLILRENSIPLPLNAQKYPKKEKFYILT